jgi:hypothetical protein
MQYTHVVTLRGDCLTIVVDAAGFSEFCLCGVSDA